MTSTAITFLSTLSPHQLPVSQRGCKCQSLYFTKSSLSKRNSPTSLCSSSSSSVIVEQGTSSSPPSDGLPFRPEFTSTQDPDALPSTGGCEACGRQELENGCNGEGRIQGGIATVPGFGWWPIKAYRPCPRFVSSGGRYRRRGQSMDEVVSGSGGNAVYRQGIEEAKLSKTKQGPRKFKK